MSLLYRLNVPYREKDEAKALGAKWNYKEKFWYCEGELTEGLRRWYDAPDAITDSNAFENTHDDSNTSFRETGIDDENDLYKTVSQVNQMIYEQFDDNISFQMIMVKGEVTNYSGHKGRNYYFAIKDDMSLLPCFMWEDTAASVLKFKLEQGQQVAIIGKLDYYKAGGKSQLIVRQIINIGDGAANLALLKLKAQLEAEGLFDEEHKKPIPKYPEKIGIITSKDGQAIKDICKVASKRNPYVQLILYHVNVQGKNAVGTIIEGIKYMDTQGVDTIIVGRGGGSDEELMAYNNEMIARTVYGAVTPIISAVGHEGHWTLIDYVSDKRVATPSEAAEEAVPDIMVDVIRVSRLRKSIEVNMINQLEQRKLLLKAGKALLEKNSPEARLKERIDRLSLLSEHIKDNITKAVELRKHRYELLVAGLHGLSPTAKLVNGFGYISRNERPVTSVEEVAKGDTLKIDIHDGTIVTEVTEIMDKI